MRRLRDRLLVAVSAFILAAATGCRTWDLHGKGYDEDTNALTENLRPSADESQFTGVDARARDIERNLGVR